jgi:pimeloyl-ACP methyl ester carboxylesterase
VLAESLLGWDMAMSALRVPALAFQPRGVGDPVLVLPGFGASDVSTTLLRAYLNRLGHDARGWGLGRNDGDVRALVPRARRLVTEWSAAAGRRVRLVGWSLGGVIAREIARDAPELVAQVVTMGSPIVGGPRYTAAGRRFARRGADLDAIERDIAERERVPIRVPITAIYSKRDGIVAWQACIDATNPRVEHVEVSCTHLGLGVHAEVLAIVARRLATRERRPG